jgi:hypothetical protein
MQYAGVGYGIAITSSYNRIIAALSSAREQLFAGMVNYLDWHRSFSYENELRLVYWDQAIQQKVNELCHSANDIIKLLSTGWLSDSVPAYDGSFISAHYRTDKMGHDRRRGRESTTCTRKLYYS